MKIEDINVDDALYYNASSMWRVGNGSPYLAIVESIDRIGVRVDLFTFAVKRIDEQTVQPDRVRHATTLCVSSRYLRGPFDETLNLVETAKAERERRDREELAKHEEQVGLARSLRDAARAAGYHDVRTLLNGGHKPLIGMSPRTFGRLFMLASGESVPDEE